MKSKFVFDTNTLVSAVLSPHSTNAWALKRANALGTVVYSTFTWNEFLNVLFRTKFDKYFSVEEREAIAEKLLLRFEKLDVHTVIKECRDLKDNMFLELATDAEADCIVTGDKDLLVLNPFRNIPILNAADFLIQYEM